MCAVLGYHVNAMGQVPRPNWQMYVFHLQRYAAQASNIRVFEMQPYRACTAVGEARAYELAGLCLKLFDVASWPLRDMPTGAADVCSWGNTGSVWRTVRATRLTNTDIARKYWMSVGNIS